MPSKPRRVMGHDECGGDSFRVDFAGPFTEHEVRVSGRCVPLVHPQRVVPFLVEDVLPHPKPQRGVRIAAFGTGVDPLSRPYGVGRPLG